MHTDTHGVKYYESAGIQKWGESRRVGIFKVAEENMAQDLFEIEEIKKFSTLTEAIEYLKKMAPLHLNQRIHVRVKRFSTLVFSILKKVLIRTKKSSKSTITYIPKKVLYSRTIMFSPPARQNYPSCSLLARSLPNGQPDACFGGGTGYMIYHNPAAIQINPYWSNAAQPDGKIVVAGVLNYQMAGTSRGMAIIKLM